MEHLRDNKMNRVAFWAPRFQKRELGHPAWSNDRLGANSDGLRFVSPEVVENATTADDIAYKTPAGEQPEITVIIHPRS